MIESNLGGKKKDAAQCVVFILFHVFTSPVASWFSHASFMRWGFEGMLQVQFSGNKYAISISNITFNVDGIHVS